MIPPQSPSLHLISHQTLCPLTDGGICYVDTDRDESILVSAALYAWVAVQYARLIGLLKRRCEFGKI